MTRSPNRGSRSQGIRRFHVAGAWAACGYIMFILHAFPAVISAMPLTEDAVAIPTVEMVGRDTVTGRISGVVTDAATREPVEAVSISVRDVGIGTVTKPDGRYMLFDVPPGWQTIVVEHPTSKGEESYAVEVVPNKTIEVNIAVARKTRSVGM